MASENGDKEVIYRCYVGGIHISPDLVNGENGIFYHQPIDVVTIRLADTAVYDHRDPSKEAVLCWEYDEISDEELIKALNRPAFVRVGRKNGGKPYLNFFSISEEDLRRYPISRDPHYFLFLLRFPNGGPLAIRYNGAFWSTEGLDKDRWDADLIAITTGRGFGSHLPSKLMIFRVNGEGSWTVLGSKVNRLQKLGELETLS